MNNIEFVISDAKLDIKQITKDGTINVLTISSYIYVTYENEYNHPPCYIFTLTASSILNNSISRFPPADIHISIDIFNSDALFRTLVDLYKLKIQNADSLSFSKSFSFIENASNDISQTLRSNLEHIVPNHYICRYKGGWHFHKDSNSYRYTGVINNLVRETARKDPVFFYKEMQPTPLAPEIKSLQTIFLQISNAFMQIKDFDTRMFLLLYYHYCYTASLFGFVQSENILCIDIPEIHYRTAFQNCLFPASTSQYILSTETKRDFLATYKNTNDIPFIISEIPTVRNTTLGKLNEIIHDIYSLQLNTASYFNYAKPLFVENNFSIPIVFTERPLISNSLYHIYFDEPYDQLHCATPIKPEQLSVYFDVFTEDFRKIFYEAWTYARQNYWLNIYTIFYTLYRLWLNTCSKLELPNYLNIFTSPDYSESFDVIELLNRYLPKISIINHATSDSFISTLERLAEDDTIPSYDRLTYEEDNCIPYDLLSNNEMAYILKDTDTDNRTVWAINGTAMKKVIACLPGQNRYTDILKLLRDHNILEKSNINEQSYQKRYMVHFQSYYDDETDEMVIDSRDDIALYGIIMPTTNEDKNFSISPPYMQPSGNHFYLGHDMEHKLPVYWDFEAETLNKHMFVTGASGSGKSYFLNQLIEQADSQKITTVVFHLEGDIPQLENSLVIDVQKDNPAIPLDDSDLSDGNILFSALSRAYRITDSQRSLIQKCFEQYYTSAESDPDLYGYAANFENCLEVINKESDSDPLKASAAVLRMWDDILTNKLFYGTPLTWDQISGHTVILDFRGYSSIPALRLQTSTMLMIYIYLLQKSKSQIDSQNDSSDDIDPLVLVIDEFQNFNTRDKSIITEILREGRKYGVSFWLASQTVKSSNGSVFNTCAKQADIRIFFNSGAENNKRIKNLLSEKNKERNRFGEILASLKRGQFIFAYSDKCTIPVDGNIRPTTETIPIQQSKIFNV